MKLTIGYITSRKEPRLEWFMDSLNAQIRAGEGICIIVVDSGFVLSEELAERIHVMSSGSQIAEIHTMAPKPSIWQGQYKITQSDWWAASNARNTAICLCQTEWIAFLDDRCVLMPGWLESVRQAMKHGYGVCGTYEKRTGMTVENGVVKHAGIITGVDGRAGNPSGAVRAPGEWWFGCSTAAPLEWYLNINGYDETCDGLSMEDCIAGHMLQNNGYPLMYDQRMKMVEDRTPEFCGPVMKREDKGVSPHDKSHAMLNMLRYRKAAMHYWNNWDLKAIRKDVLSGKPFPIPEAKMYKDWYDDTVINGI